MHMDLPERPFHLSPGEDALAMKDVARRMADDVLRPQADDAESQGLSGETQETFDALGLAEVVADVSASETLIPVDLAYALEEFGRGDMGQAIAGLISLSGVSAAHAMTNEDNASPLREAILAASPAIAVMEQSLAFDAAFVSTWQTEATGGESAVILNGEKRLVARSGSYLVCARRGKEAVIAMVSATDPGVTVTEDGAMGLGAMKPQKVTLDGVSVPSSRVVAIDENILAWRMRLAHIMLAVGCGQGVIDYVVPYCNERVAFGEPISHKQAVAFAVADAATHVEVVRLSALRALARMSADVPWVEQARHAWRLAKEYLPAVGSTGVQVLGGHGYTREHPVEMWYRNLRSVGSIDGVACL